MNPRERSPDLHCGRARVDSTSPYAPFQEVDGCEQRPLQVYQCQKKSYLPRVFEYSGQHIVSLLLSLKMDLRHAIVVFVVFWRYWPSESDYGYILPIMNVTEAGIWGKSKAGAVCSGSSPLGLDWWSSFFPTFLCFFNQSLYGFHPFKY